VKRCDERARECRVVRRTSALALRSALGQPECGVWGPGRLAYGEQLSACALIIFQKQWHVDDRRLVTNQKCCIEIYGTVTFTVKRKDQIKCTAWPYGFMGYALQIEPCSMVHAVAGFGIHGAA
jgi:hypothetical protein